MSAQPNRLPSGGRIDRATDLAFTFDGRRYHGHPGDTLASALIANGVSLVGRSFKYHRPRGIFSAGPEEPNAIVRLRSADRAEPNTRATTVELYDGLEAESQNRWPSLDWDVLALNARLAPLFPAGFYYKTFMWPPRMWTAYERLIRRAAGLGRANPFPDPDYYDKRNLHCDVLVVGAGPAGLAAAATAARSGARVVLADENPDFGGQLRFDRHEIDGGDASAWIDRQLASLGQCRDVVLLRRTTAFGFYDHNTVALVERVTDHLAQAPSTLPRQRLYQVRAKQVILATGAIERPLVFANNDLPGVMLASAARRYVNQYAVAPGRRVVVFTNNGDAYRTALALCAAGLEVVALVDARAQPDGPLAAAVRREGIEILAGHVMVAARGRRRVDAAEIAALAPDGETLGPTRVLRCDLVAVSGGWTPSVHLHSQSGGRLVYGADIGAFVPGAAKQSSSSVGAARGAFDLAECLADGVRSGAAAADAAGFRASPDLVFPAAGAAEPWHIRPLWSVSRARGGKRFVDLQNDVTAEDVALAARENYRSVEHLKRYTTLGMGTDQGKTSNLNGLAIMAGLLGEPVAEVGTTTFRPPVTPVTLGALAGHNVGGHFEPTRRTPLHDWHQRHGAIFVTVGLWVRARAYLRPGEPFEQAWMRESRQVRERVGLMDVSTLGKIDIQGPDAAEFLDRVYSNGWKTLEVGRVRYGLMLREDGIVLDDGTTARIGPARYYMTTTTANAGRVMSHLEYLLQAVWPELRVQVASVTDQWAQFALAGPRSRDVLCAAVQGADVGDAALPHLGVMEARIAGAPVRLFRVSFSGELAYEIATPADFGTGVWEALLRAGSPMGIGPYGTEAMGVLRIEKGHVAGPELDGRTSPADLGMTRLVSAKKPFVGRRMLERPALRDPDRPTLVGLVPLDERESITPGAQLIEDARQPPPVPMLGHVTSATFSPTLGHSIGLALLARAAERKGRTLVAASPLSGALVRVRVVAPVFYDPQGSRLHA